MSKKSSISFDRDTNGLQWHITIEAPGKTFKGDGIILAAEGLSPTREYQAAFAEIGKKLKEWELVLKYA